MYQPPTICFILNSSKLIKFENITNNFVSKLTQKSKSLC